MLTHLLISKGIIFSISSSSSEEMTLKKTARTLAVIDLSNLEPIEEISGVKVGDVFYDVYGNRSSISSLHQLMRAPIRPVD